MSDKSTIHVSYNHNYLNSSSSHFTSAYFDQILISYIKQIIFLTILLILLFVYKSYHEKSFGKYADGGKTYLIGIEKISYFKGSIYIIYIYKLIIYEIRGKISVTRTVKMKLYPNPRTSLRRSIRRQMSFK